VSARGRAGLISRIRQIRPASPSEPVLPEGETLEDPGRIQALEARVKYLEELIQGLQDSVYREAQRASKRITDLEARIEPAAVAASLSKNARDRGI
jgi:hypothetical protein